MVNPLVQKVANRCAHAVHIAARTRAKQSGIRTASVQSRLGFTEQLYNDVFQLGVIVAHVRTPAVFPKTLILPEAFTL